MIHAADVLCNRPSVATPEFYTENVVVNHNGCHCSLVDILQLGKGLYSLIKRLSCQTSGSKFVSSLIILFLRSY